MGNTQDIIFDAREISIGSNSNPIKIWGCRGDDHAGYDVLGCDAVYFVIYVLRFWRNMLPPSSR